MTAANRLLERPATLETIEPVAADTCCPPVNAMPGCCAPGSVSAMAVETAENLARLFKAVSSPVRVQMLDILSRHGGEVCVCDIENQFDLSQPTISHHLGVLRKAGLVESEQRGLWAFYYVRPGAVEQVRGWLGGLIEEAGA